MLTYEHNNTLNPGLLRGRTIGINHQDVDVVETRCETRVIHIYFIYFI